MEEKFHALLVYGFLGVVIAIIIPALENMRPVFFMRPISLIEKQERLFSFFIMLVMTSLCLVLLNPLTAWTYILVCAIGCSPLIPLSISNDKARDSGMLFLALIVSGFLPWWIRSGVSFSPTFFQSIIPPVLILLAYRGLSRKIDKPIFENKFALSILITLIFLIVTIFLIFSTGSSYILPLPIEWHHWSAYIGPAQMVSAGALPFRDIPLQYGAGPTFILAAGCAIGRCWQTLFWMAGASTLTLTILIALLVIRLGNFFEPIAMASALAVVVAACLLWTSFPPSLLPVLATPSTTGLRFLPGTAFLTWIIHDLSKQTCSRKGFFFGHLIWLFCIFWAPEAGFQATAMWVPYFFWRRAFEKNQSFSNLEAIYSVATLIIFGFIGLTIFLIAYQYFFGEWPLLNEYFTYMIHPPGLLSINLRGTIIVPFFCLGIWLFSRLSIQHRASFEAQASWVVALFSFATFSYYLGRSHDNNILNLIPYLLLLLTSTRSASSAPSIKVFSTALIAAIIGWLPAFGFGNFSSALSNGVLFEFSPNRLISSFSRENEFGLKHINSTAQQTGSELRDLSSAIMEIEKNFDEAITVFDYPPLLLIDSDSTYSPWNALHGPENFVDIPSGLRRKYLENVKIRFGRSGWVIYNEAVNISSYLSDYDAVYEREREFTFGSYKAIRYVPK